MFRRIGGNLVDLDSKIGKVTCDFLPRIRLAGLGLEDLWVDQCGALGDSEDDDCWAIMTRLGRAWSQVGFGF